MTDKQEAIKTITKCAKDYKAKLFDKNLMFVYRIREENKYRYFEIVFMESNFCHLTGVEIKSNISVVDFYNKCVESKLREEDFDFKKDGTTEMKLKVLPKIIHIYRASQMTGIFNNSRLKLYTERLAGGINGCMGFKKDIKSEYYVPNTVLQEDIRKITTKTHRVVATFMKNKTERFYNEITYKAKNFDLSELEACEEIFEKLEEGLIT